MVAINFPDAPVNGDVFTTAGFSVEYLVVAGGGSGGEDIGGGGGGGNSAGNTGQSGGAGGSGILIVRYLKTAVA